MDLDPLIVRIMALALCIVTLGLGGAAYVAMWALLPQEPERDMPCEVRAEQVRSDALGLLDAGAPMPGARCGAEDETGFSLIVRIAAAVCFIMLFLVVAMTVSPLISGSQWWQFWPVGLVIVGLGLAVLPTGSDHVAHWRAVGIVLAVIALSSLPMSLGVASWHTFAVALSQMWPLALLAVTLFAVSVRKGAAFAVAGALAVAVFCVLMLTYYVVPGDVAHLLVSMPGGRSVRIAFSSM